MPGVYSFRPSSPLGIYIPLPLSVYIPIISARGKSSPEDDLMRKSTGSSSHSSGMVKATLVSVVSTGDDSRPTTVSPKVQKSTAKPIGDN